MRAIRGCGLDLAEIVDEIQPSGQASITANAAKLQQSWVQSQNPPILWNVRGGRCNIGNDFICCSYTILPSHRFLRPMGTIFHMKNISTEHSFLKSRICFIYGTVCPYIMCIFEDIYIVRTKNLFCQTLLLVLLQNRALLQSILIEISLLKIIFVPLFCFNKEDFSA